MSVELLVGTGMDRYYQAEGDDARFRDLTRPDVLVGPDSVPPIVLDDERWGPGVEYLKWAGEAGRLSIALVFGPHVGEQDFTDMVREHGDVLASATAVGIETDWQSFVDAELPPDADPRFHVNYIFDKREWRREYQEAQLSWLKERAVIALPFERETTEQDILVDELRFLRGVIAEAARTAYCRDETQRNAVRELAVGSHTYHRMWGFVGQVGHWARMLDQSGVLPDEGGIEIPVMMGDWNNIQPHLELLHVPNRPLKLHHRTRPARMLEADYGEVFTSMGISGRATAAQLRVPVPFPMT